MSDEQAATATQTEDATSTETTEDAQAPTEKGDQLGPEGQKALDAFKRRARDAEKALKERDDRLAKIEEANKSESEKALDKARKDARKEAEAEFEKERRSDRLAVAVAGHARELADVDDVVLNLKQGDVEELFDDEGKVKADALKKALDDLTKRKPHLKATGTGKPTGSADGGEGEGGGAKSFNDLLRGR